MKRTRPAPVKWQSADWDLEAHARLDVRKSTTGRNVRGWMFDLARGGEAIGHAGIEFPIEEQPTAKAFFRELPEDLAQAANGLLLAVPT